MNNTKEFIFIKSVKNGIPNRDSVTNEARFVETENGVKIYLSPVSMQRDVRDYIIFEGEKEEQHIFVKESRDENGKLKTRKTLGYEIVSQLSGKNLEEIEKMNGEEIKEYLLKHCIDIRLFGISFTVKDQTFSLARAVSMDWAVNMHKVTPVNMSGTTVLPSDEGKGQGTGWSLQILPFALFMATGDVNYFEAAENHTTEEDVDKFFRALWLGTKFRVGFGRGMQVPVFLLVIDYNEPEFKIGHLDDYLSVENKEYERISDVTLLNKPLIKKLQKHKDKINRIRLIYDDRLRIDEDFAKVGVPVEGVII